MSFIRVDDIQLAYEDAGLGLPVVLLHGYPFNRSLWTEQVSALSNSYRVVTPDLRGLGESDAKPGAATMNQMAQDVAVLLDQLEISRAVIGGLLFATPTTLLIVPYLFAKLRRSNDGKKAHGVFEGV